jgi:ribosomal protein S18 acetylase RimI-like enzyme
MSKRKAHRMIIGERNELAIGYWPSAIRMAVPEDAKAAIPLILQAIGQIAFLLSGTTDKAETEAILSDFFRQPANRLSYECTLVLEEDSEAVGIAIVYDGADARALTAPLERAAAQKTGKLDYCIPMEPEVSEFYLDALSVLARCHRRGYGRALIEAGCERAKKLGHTRFALLVDVDNPSAKRLYSRLGFYTDSSKWIAGHEYSHMVRDLTVMGKVIGDS